MAPQNPMKQRQSNTASKPTHMVLINCRTRMPVGEAIPIAKGDWPYKDVAASQVLWRYFNGQKFFDLCATKTLYFARADRFEDVLEGLKSPENPQGRSETERAFDEAYNIKREWDMQAEGHQAMRMAAFVSCWHMNQRESRAMWRSYNLSSDSVAVVTSVKALCRAMKGDQIVGRPVRYVTPEHPRPEFDNYNLLFYKYRDKYGWDR